MKDRPQPLDEFEAAWMEDLAQDRTQTDLKTFKRLQGTMMVDASLKKAHPLSIRISESDLEAIQLKAAKKGMPYQTLIKSLLHQFATDQLKL